MKFPNSAYIGFLAVAAVSTGTSAFTLAPRSRSCSSSTIVSSPSSRVIITSSSSSSTIIAPPYVTRHGISLMSSEEELSAFSSSSVAADDEGDDNAEEEEEEESSSIIASEDNEEEPAKDDDAAVVKHTVYVGNLPFTTTGDDITRLFEENDVTVLNVAMPMNLNVPADPETGDHPSKGFCFVDVESEEMISTAIDRLSESSVDGRPIRINKLLPKSEIEAKSNTRPVRNVIPDGQKKLYVGNLPFDATEEDVRFLFTEYGDITDIFLPQRDGQPRGFGFVTLDEEGADKAAEDLNGTVFQGRNLVINEPLKKGEKPPPRPRRPQFKLYVGNLSFYTTQDTLYNVFSEFGEVYDCYLPTDPNTDQPRGFGFITMERADGEAAIAELDGLEIDGRFIKVNEAQGKRRGPSSFAPPPSPADDYDGGDDEGGFF